MAGFEVRRVVQVTAGLVLGAGLLTGAGSASAATVTFNGGTSAALCGTSNANNQPGVEILVESAGCSNGVQLTEYYKANYQGSDERAFAGSYDAINWIGDPNGVTISYTGGSKIVCPDCFIAIKDGANNPGIYAFDISAWDGMSSILLSGFWPAPATGGISNVSIWGKVDTTNPPVTVPEPTGLALVGVALLAAGLSGRRARRT